jgi:hypothetical protein
MPVPAPGPSVPITFNFTNLTFPQFQQPGPASGTGYRDGDWGGASTVVPTPAYGGSNGVADYNNSDDSGDLSDFLRAFFGNSSGGAGGNSFGSIGSNIGSNVGSAVGGSSEKNSNTNDFSSMFAMLLQFLTSFREEGNSGSAG